MVELRDEARRKEQRWQSSAARLRDRVDSLEQENGELKEEIRLLEKRRLETWQQKESKPKTAAAAHVSSSNSHKKLASSDRHSFGGSNSSLPAASAPALSNHATVPTSPSRHAPPKRATASTHSSSAVKPLHELHPPHRAQHSIKKSTSGPQLSSRSTTPKPHRHSRSAMHRESRLRLSNDQLHRSAQSLDCGKITISTIFQNRLLLSCFLTF